MAFLLLSLAFSPNLGLFLFLQSLPFFCFCSALWGPCFQFVSKSFPNLSLWERSCPPQQFHEFLLSSSSGPAAPQVGLTYTTSDPSWAMFPFSCWARIHTSPLKFFTTLSTSNFTFMEIKGLQSLKLHPSHSNSETPSLPALSTFLLFPKTSSPAQTLIPTVDTVHFLTLPTK